jgi:hypothetical protein
VLNYETQWMNRDQIVASTYEAGRRLNLIKGEFGVIDAKLAEQTDERIATAVKLIGEIDRIMLMPDAGVRRESILDLKHRVDNSNLSTVCDKGELELPMGKQGINVLQAAAVVAKDWLRDVRRK